MERHNIDLVFCFSTEFHQKSEKIETKTANGCGMIINSARGIIFASNSVNFAEATRRETEKLNNFIRELL
jgi:hypothetical protein